MFHIQDFSDSNSVLLYLWLNVSNFWASLGFPGDGQLDSMASSPSHLHFCFLQFAWASIICTHAFQLLECCHCQLWFCFPCSCGNTQFLSLFYLCVLCFRREHNYISIFCNFCVIFSAYCELSRHTSFKCNILTNRVLHKIAQISIVIIFNHLHFNNLYISIQLANFLFM